MRREGFPPTFSSDNENRQEREKGDRGRSEEIDRSTLVTFVDPIPRRDGVLARRLPLPEVPRGASRRRGRSCRATRTIRHSDPSDFPDPGGINRGCSRRARPQVGRPEATDGRRRRRPGGDAEKSRVDGQLRPQRRRQRRRRRRRRRRPVVVHALDSVARRVRTSPTTTSAHTHDFPTPRGRTRTHWLAPTRSRDMAPPAWEPETRSRPAPGIETPNRARSSRRRERGEMRLAAAAAAHIHKVRVPNLRPINYDVD